MKSGGKRPMYPQGGQRTMKSANTGYRTPSYGDNTIPQAKRNSASTKAQSMYNGQAGNGARNGRTTGSRSGGGGY